MNILQPHTKLLTHSAIFLRPQFYYFNIVEKRLNKLRTKPDQLRNIAAYSCSSVTMSKEVVEWTAPKVRSTFIEYFREREHTVGKF